MQVKPFASRERFRQVGRKRNRGEEKRGRAAVSWRLHSLPVQIDGGGSLSLLFAVNAVIGSGWEFSGPWSELV